MKKAKTGIWKGLKGGNENVEVCNYINYRRIKEILLEQHCSFLLSLTNCIDFVCTLRTLISFLLSQANMLQRERKDLTPKSCFKSDITEITKVCVILYAKQQHHLSLTFNKIRSPNNCFSLFITISF